MNTSENRQKTDTAVYPLSVPSKKILHRLQSAGFEAYLVGGCVRDFLLGRVPTDFDVTTNALPAEIQAVFADAETFDTGIQHGTVTVLIDRMPFEVTTYRVDLGYSDGRHPDAVHFTRSLREDAARRDFTVNAMAYNDSEGLKDFFGGKDDLAARIIRCVGEPDRRFQEDALRVLRAIRFAAVLGFSIEPATAQSLFDHAERLTSVSKERITAELTKLLCGKAVQPVLSAYMPVLFPCLPELRILPRGAIQSTANICGAVPASPALRLAGLFSGLTTAEAFSALTRLRLPSRLVSDVRALLLHLPEPLEPDRPSLRRLLGTLGAERLEGLLSLKRAVCQETGDAVGEDAATSAADLTRRILADGDCCTIRQLAVSGSDLMALGFRGTAVGQLLHQLLKAVTDDRLPNERSTLLNALHTLDKGA